MSFQLFLIFFLFLPSLTWPNLQQPDLLWSGPDSIHVEQGLVEQAKSFRGKTSDEPRPNWNPLLFSVSPRMYVCMSVCMYVCMYEMCVLSMYVSFHISVSLCAQFMTVVHFYIHTYVHTYIHRYIHTYIHSYIHTFIPFIHAYKHTFLHTYITYIHAFIKVCLHTLTCCVYIDRTEWIYVCIFIGHGVGAILWPAEPTLPWPTAREAPPRRQRAQHRGGGACPLHLQGERPRHRGQMQQVRALPRY